MAGGRPPAFISFTCPNCQALYHIVKVEAGPETANSARAVPRFQAAKASTFSNISFCGNLGHQAMEEGAERRSALMPARSGRAYALRAKNRLTEFDENEHGAGVFCDVR
jgi:hypothetical protein